MRRKKNLKEVENVKKKVGSLLLAVVMIVTALPVFGTKVHAAELPDSTQFATVDELKAFNTNDQEFISVTTISDGGLQELSIIILFCLQQMY